MRSYWSRWIQCDWTCEERPARRGPCDLRQRLEWCRCKPRSAGRTGNQEKGMEQLPPGPARSMAYQHLDFRLLASRTKAERICWCQLPSLWHFVGAALGEQYRGNAVLSVPHVPCSPSACRPSPAFSLCAFLAMSSPSKMMCRRN